MLEIATLDALALENTIARSRVLIAAGLAAVKLLEVGDLAARMKALEAARTTRPADDPFEDGP